VIRDTKFAKRKIATELVI